MFLNVKHNLAGFQRLFLHVHYTGHLHLISIFHFDNGLFQVPIIFPQIFRLCLSISDFHPDTWNPAWSVSTILTGLLSFMVCFQFDVHAIVLE